MTGGQWVLAIVAGWVGCAVLVAAALGRAARAEQPPPRPAVHGDLRGELISLYGLDDDATDDTIVIAAMARIGDTP